MIGETLGSYRILSQIGAGAMGEVYLAEHRHLKRKAAVKLLSQELQGRPDLLERFFMEARATSAIEHPGIVQIFDCEIDPAGRPYIVMELLTGETVAALLARRAAPLAPLTAARLVRGVAEALDAAHSKGIVHRDIKPENIFVQPQPPDSVKLVDFGIAKLAGELQAGQMHRTRSGVLMGTPLYMSPEQCRDSGRLDFRTDLYSLGVVLYEMLAGRPPFVHNGLGELVVAHLTEEPQDPRSFNPAVPPALVELAAHLLRKDPAHRPASMREVADRLASFATSVTTVPDAWPRATVPPADAAAASGARTAQPTGGRSAVSGAAPRPGSAATGRVTGTTFGNVAAELVTGESADVVPRSRTGPIVAVLAVVLAAGGGGGLYFWKLGRAPEGDSKTVAMEPPATAPPPAVPPPAQPPPAVAPPAAAAPPAAPPPAVPPAPAAQVEAPPPSAQAAAPRAEASATQAPPQAARDPANESPRGATRPGAPSRRRAQEPAARLGPARGRPPATVAAAGVTRETPAATSVARENPAAAPEAPTPPPPPPAAVGLAGAWEGPWNDAEKHQSGRLFLQITGGTAGGPVSGWMYNNSAKQSFPLAGRLGPGGQLDLTCRCPPGQAFSIRGTIQPQANAAELRGRMALYAAAGVFGRSEVVLRRAKH